MIYLVQHSKAIENRTETVSYITKLRHKRHLLECIVNNESLQSLRRSVLVTLESVFLWLT